MHKLSLLLSLLCLLGKVSYLSAFNIEEKWVQVDQAELFCRTLGSGKPLIVIHGGAGLSQDYLLPWMTQLAKNNFVIFYDQRGCGRSTGEINADTINVAKFLEDLDAIRKAFNFETVTVLGHSWGGFVGMQYAISYPDSVNKLILSNSMPSTAQGLDLFVKEYIRKLAPNQTEISTIQQNPEFQLGNPSFHERWLHLIFRMYCYDPKQADFLNLKLSRQACINSQKIYQIFRQNVLEQPFDLNASLRNLRIPTLIIHGDSDPIPISTAQEIHQNIPDSHFLVLPKCGHFPYVEKPDAYFASICAFLMK